MRSVIVSTSASGTYAGGSGNGIPLDPHISPFNVGVGVVITSGTPVITVQHTFNDMFVSVTAPHWFNHAALTSVGTTVDDNYAFPVAGVRVQQTGAGDAVIYFIQAGI